MGIAWTGIGLILIIALYINNNTATKNKKNICLGVTLPFLVVKNKDVMKIVDDYKKANVILMILSIIVFIPTLFINYMSFQILYFFLWVVLIMYSSNKLFCKYNEKLLKLKRQNNWFSSSKKLLNSESGTPIYIDNDEYWKNNVYNNPNDPRTKVEKRVGYGFQYNLATKKGRFITYGSYALVIFITLVLMAMFFISDFSKVSISINDELVKISAPMYGTEFYVSDINDIDMINSISVGLRTNGTSTNRYSYGHFYVKDYGSSMLFIQHGNTPYIVIKVDGKYVFINGTNKEETQTYYEELMEVWNGIQN